MTLIGFAFAGKKVVTNTQNSGSGSLRQAINDLSNNDSIVFNIPTSDANFDASRGVFKITITSTLPAIAKSNIVIDGLSQTNFTGNTNTAILVSVELWALKS